MEQRTPDAKQTKRKLLDQTAQTLIAALLLGSASGCATMDYDDGYSRPPMYSARLSPRPVRIVQVLPGDTIESVAQRFNVSEEAIVEANDLRAPYRLRRGQSLVLPPSSVHIVSSGETIASIARSYGVSPNVIVDVNNLHAPDTLYPGERLTIPYVAPRQVARVERIPQAVTRDELTPPAAEQRETGIDPRLAGARYYGSGLPRHKPGPTGEGGPEFSSPRQITNADPADEAFDASHHAKPRQVASIDPADEAFDAPARHGKPATPDAPVKASSRFVWPVHGQIISTFGKRSNGVHNDGINIAAEPGSSVKAADNGVVVYAGNELAGYGNLLLIRHSNGFVTAYAHNKKLLVGKGDSVRQGQTIATVGSTGDVDRPQLHFEIRKGDHPVDPGCYLESTNASL